MQAIARQLDRVLAWLKWPTAIAAVVLVPGLAVALARVARVIWHDPDPSLAFLAGGVAFVLVWLVLLRRSALGRFIVTFEHELTHALFAWLTFHRVVGFRASPGSGGHVRYVGRGNWLITIAPYFVPTLALMAVAVVAWLPERHAASGGAALGAALGYHGVSTWSETHREQSDLRDVGWFFSLLFLPAANALMIGLILATACGVSPRDFLEPVAETTVEILRQVSRGG